jgi:flagellar hook-associated protein 1 FlgK
MSIPTLTGIQTALSGIESEQVALDTTGNNIDNATTPGYSEEVVNLDVSTPLEIPAQSGDGVTQTQLGTGVDVASITRQRDAYLDAGYRAQNSILGYNTQSATSLGNAQTLFAEPSSSALSGQLQTFWSDWSALANNPSSGAARQTVVTDATTLTQTFSNLYSQLSNLQTQASSQYSSLTGSGGQVEQLANQIATLNGSIKNAIQGGQSPNTLEDQRDTALDTLSGLGQVSVTNQSDGTVTVNFGDASSPLVSGSTFDWPQTITSATGGQLGALLNASSASGPIGTYMSSLNSVANDLATSVNGVATGTAFFSGSTASTIAVAVTPSQIQTSSTNTAGGNDVAQGIAALQGGTTDQAYDALVAQLGDNVQNAQSGQTTSQAIVTAMANQRQSVSGVSLDEEMTNLITYQRGYQAAAQTLNALNTVLQTLIQQVG